MKIRLYFLLPLDKRDEFINDQDMLTNDEYIAKWGKYETNDVFNTPPTLKEVLYKRGLCIDTYLADFIPPKAEDEKQTLSKPGIHGNTFRMKFNKEWIGKATKNEENQEAYNKSIDELIKNFIKVRSKAEVVDVPEESSIINFIPYQQCPICLGKGRVSDDGISSVTSVVCDVCQGAKIIPMYRNEK